MTHSSRDFYAEGWEAFVPESRPKMDFIQGATPGAISDGITVPADVLNAPDVTGQLWGESYPAWTIWLDGYRAAEDRHDFPINEKEIPF